MNRPRSYRPAKLAAAFYLVALGLPAALPIAAGLGHAVFHVARVVQEARAFESTFLSPHLSGTVPDGPALSVGPGSAGPQRLEHVHEGDRLPEGHARAPGGLVPARSGPATAGGSILQDATHTHGSAGAHTHNTVVDGGLTLVTGGSAEGVSPRAASAGVDTHVQPGSIPLDTPPTFEAEVIVVLALAPLATGSPAVPPPKV